MTKDLLKLLEEIVIFDLVEITGISYKNIKEIKDTNTNIYYDMLDHPGRSII